MAPPENREGIPIYRWNGSKLPVSRAIAFLVAGLMLLQAAAWLPASAEEIEEQAHEVGLYLWSESGEGKLSARVDLLRLVGVGEAVCVHPLSAFQAGAAGVGRPYCPYGPERAPFVFHSNYFWDLVFP